MIVINKETLGKKLKSIILLIVCILIGWFMHVGLVTGLDNLVVDNVSDITDEAIKLNIVINDQEFISRTVTLELEINPSIDSGKVAIDWVFDKNIFNIVGDSKEIISLNANNKFVTTKKFIPATQYSRSLDFETRIVAKVNAAAYEINYLSTRSFLIKMNQNYEILPLLERYKTIKAISLYGGVVLIIFSISTLIVLGVNIYNKFYIYLNTDEEK